jgi:putative ABC transport system substrate-binding protein
MSTPYKKIIIICVSILTIWSTYKKFNQKKESLMIAIIQGASHPAVDKAHQNFKDRLEYLIGKKIDFLSFNTQGSAANAFTLARQLKENKNIDLFFTIDTATTLAFAKSIPDKPIIFMAVENPIELGLIKKGSNLAGLTDSIEESIILKMIKDTKIKVKKIGLLHKNESSKQTIFEKIKLLLEKSNFEFIEISVNDEFELMNSLSSNIDKIDMIFSSTDNLVASCFPIINKLAKQYKVPFFVCLGNGAENGAFCSVGMKYEYNGFDAANMAYEVLVKKIKIDSIPLQYGNYDTWTFNKKTAEIIEQEIPENIPCAKISIV